MKKFIRNLLVGFMPFFPVEKAYSASSMQVETPDWDTELTSLLAELERGKKLDLPTDSTKEVDDVEEALRLLDEMSVVDAKVFLTPDGLSTNGTTQVQTVLEEKQSLQPSENVVEEEVSTNAAPVSEEETSIAPEIPEDATETPVPVVNEEQSTVADGIPEFSKSDIAPSEQPKSDSPVSEEEVSVTPEIPEDTTETPVLVVNEEQSTVAEGLPEVSESVVSNTEESGEVSSPKIEKVPTAPTSVVKGTQESPSKKSKEKSVPLSKKSWFPLAISFLGAAGFYGFAWLVEMFDKKNRPQKKRNRSNSNIDMSRQIISEMIQNGQGTLKKMGLPLSVEKETLPVQEVINELTPVQLEKNMDLNPRKREPISTLVNTMDGDEAHQKGIRMLANIKARRAAIARRMKELNAMQEEGYVDVSKTMDIADEMDRLLEERKSLSMQARQARSLVKGKQGELIKEERRLLAKEMRLAKKTNDTERIEKIMAKRLALKEQEKQIFLEAKEQVKERQEAADHLRSMRLFRDARTQENALKEKIKKIQKETGLKKREILATDETLKVADKAIKSKKSLARKKSKASFGVDERRRLSREIILAHKQKDEVTENKLKNELHALKQIEKEYIKNTEHFDYPGFRRTVISPVIVERIKAREAEEAHRQQVLAQNRARLEEAHFLRGQRMLRDLKSGMVDSVNFNRVPLSGYKAEAESLLGARKDEQFDYEKRRASYLKPSTLGKIYLSKQRRGLI